MSDQPTVLSREGQYLRLGGRYEEALLRYEKLIEIHKENYEAWFYKGTCLRMLGRYEEAIRAYETTLAIYPNHDLAKDGIELCKESLQK